MPRGLENQLLPVVRENEPIAPIPRMRTLTVPDQREQQKMRISPIQLVNTFTSLKGQCHEDFAVLGQFCAKIITLRLYS